MEKSRTDYLKRLADDKVSNWNYTINTTCQYLTILLSLNQIQQYH